MLADDFALDRVPPDARRPMREILWVELGIVTGMSEFVLASTLGYGMSFWKAFLAISIGSALLTSTGVLIGLAGVWEGLPSGLLSRWSGFGKYGSTLISIIVVFGCTAWFGVQNSICAAAIQRATHGRVPFAIAATATGALVLVIAMLGIHWLARTAAIAVPLFVVVAGYGVVRALSHAAIGPILTEAAPGPALTVVTGASMVVGSFMLGSILAPDFTRYCRKGRDVFWIIVVSIFFGQFVLGFAGVVLAHSARTRDVISIIFGVAGWLGVTIVFLATLKLNDLNLYSASLHLANFIEVIFHRRINRAILTVALGVLGITLSILGILDRIVGFLLTLGIAVPPIAGVLIVDYFVLRRDRKALEDTRETLSLPRFCETLNPVALLAWLSGFFAGEFIHAGVASFNSVLVGGGVYFVVMKLIAIAEGKSVKRFSVLTGGAPES